MRALLQRVSSAKVDIAGETVGQIGKGLLILLGVCSGDGEAEISYLADKIAHLRIFEDRESRMNRSLLDIGGEALVVSQFTLYADTRKGRRPSFTAAASPALAEPLYARFCDKLRGAGINVASGRFGAMMDVTLVNQGPVTILIDSSQQPGGQ